MSNLTLTVSRTDTPVAMCSPAYDSIRFDSGLYGAISRTAKISEALAMTDPRDERAHADIGRIERLYWLTARWHGYIGVDFLMDWPAEGPLSDSKIIHWGTIAFFMLHEIGHAIQHLKGFDLTPFESELKSDSLALSLLRRLAETSDQRVAADFKLDTTCTSRSNPEDIDKIAEWITINLSVLREPAHLWGVVELAAFVMRRDDEARFLEPPRAYPHWSVRREKLLASLAASYPSAHTGALFDRLHRTVELAQPCYRSVPLDSLDDLFRRNQQMLVKTSDENFRHADLLEDFDEAFHAPTYRLLLKLVLDNHPNQNALSLKEVQELIDNMDEAFRQIVASTSPILPATTDPRRLYDEGIPFRFFYVPDLPPGMGGGCARYRAMDLGLVPREAKR